MKTRIKKTAIFMSLIGLIIAATSGYFAFDQYQIIQNGELISGTVTKIISVQNDDGITYKPEVSYEWSGENMTYTPSYSSNFNKRRVGDTVSLKVSDRGVTFDGFHQGWIPLIVGFGSGILFFIFGVLWFIKRLSKHDRNIKLKRFGRRVSARFVKKEKTNYSVANQTGTIIYLQEENGNRMFQTHPIFSDFSIKWLEEHIFDVYIDTSNPDEYYIDIEKHFGEPQPHKF